MTEKSIKQWWKIFRERPFLVISIFIVSLGICWAIMGFFYSETITSKNNLIESKQSQIDDYQIAIEEKGDLVEELRHEILRNSIKNNALNISIQNSNIQTSSFGNWSCSEKDIIIDEFANKITEQDESLITCNNNYKSLKEDYLEIEQKIPDYSKGFTGKDISVGKGGTFQADGGKFTLSVVNTEAISSINRYQTTFKLNGIGYTKGIGDFVVFDYYGTNYTLNLKSTNNPAIFYAYKTNSE